MKKILIAAVAATSVLAGTAYAEPATQAEAIAAAVEEANNREVDGRTLEEWRDLFYDARAALTKEVYDERDATAAAKTELADVKADLADVKEELADIKYLGANYQAKLKAELTKRAAALEAAKDAKGKTKADAKGGLTKANVWSTVKDDDKITEVRVQLNHNKVAYGTDIELGDEDSQDSVDKLARDIAVKSYREGAVAGFNKGYEAAYNDIMSELNK